MCRDIFKKAEEYTGLKRSDIVDFSDIDFFIKSRILLFHLFFKLKFSIVHPIHHLR